jgi:hypothetical protein
VAVDASGNVFVADSGNNAVKELVAVNGSIPTSPTILTLGSGFFDPEGVAVDASGNVFVADFGNNAVKELVAVNGSIPTSPTILTLLSGGSQNEIDRVAVDGSGKVFVTIAELTDYGTQDDLGAVWEISRATPPSLSFNPTLPGVESSDSPQSVTVSNDGNAALTFPIPGTGDNPSITAGFTLNSATTCPQLIHSSSAASLAEGASCVYVFDFKPPAAGAYPGSAVLTDDNLNAPSAKQSIGLSGTGALVVVSPSTLPAGTVGAAYSQQLSASGGTSPYAYSVTAGSLPAGLSLSTTGLITGTPTAGGNNFPFTVTAKDSSPSPGPYTGSQPCTLTVNPPTVAITLPSGSFNGKIGVAYSLQLSASGGTSPYTFAPAGGSLPTGLTLSSTTGSITGTPTAGGNFSITVTATDSSTGAGPYTGSQNQLLGVQQPNIAVTPSTVPAGTVGAAYSQTITASGGTSPYTYSVNGSLPAGLTLSSAGSLTGTPTAGGNFSITVTAEDSSTGTGPYTGKQPYTLTVHAPTIAVTPSTLPAATVGAAYSQTITADGGTSPYTYSVTTGSLPAGLTLSSAGLLTGTPTAGGSFSFRVTAKDSSTSTGPYTGKQPYTLTVNAAPVVSLSAASLAFSY